MNPTEKSIATLNAPQDENTLAGIPYLTKDSQGFVYWKGEQVEHYSYQEGSKESAAAGRLADRCRQLEAIDFPVNSRTVLFESCFGATTGTPWKLALQRYYAFFQLNGRIAAVFFRTTEAHSLRNKAPAFAVWVEGGQVQVQDFENGYEAFHSLQDRGAVCARSKDSFADVQALLYQIGVSPQRLNSEMDGLSQSNSALHAAFG
jgi:hypothetical protein